MLHLSLTARLRYTPLLKYSLTPSVSIVEPTSVPSTTAEPSSVKSPSGETIRTAVVVVGCLLGGFFILALLCSIIYWFRRKQSRTVIPAFYDLSREHTESIGEFKTESRPVSGLTIDQIAVEPYILPTNPGYGRSIPIHSVQ